MLRLLAAALPLTVALAQAPRMPDAAAQREAMKKLEFLVGKWSGEATVSRGPGEPLKVQQTEVVQYKLDGLVLLVEGTGRDASGKTVFQALATIAYDDAAKVYRMRPYTDGRYLDVELKLAPDGKGFEWGFDAGRGRVRYTMKLTERGEWNEIGEFQMGDGPARRMIDMTVRRQP